MVQIERSLRNQDPSYEEIEGGDIKEYVFDVPK